MTTRRLFLSGLAALAACTPDPVDPPGSRDREAFDELPPHFDVDRGRNALEALAALGPFHGLETLADQADHTLRQLALVQPEVAAFLGATLDQLVFRQLELVATLPGEDDEDAFLEALNQSLDLSQGKTALQESLDGFVGVQQAQPDRSGVVRDLYALMEGFRSELEGSGHGQDPLVLRVKARFERDMALFPDADGAQVSQRASQALETLGRSVQADPQPPPDTGESDSEPAQQPTDAQCAVAESAWDRYLRQREFLLSAFDAVANATLDGIYALDGTFRVGPSVFVSPGQMLVALVGMGMLFLLMPFLLYVPDLPSAPALVRVCECGS